MRKIIVIAGVVILVAAAAFLGYKYFPVQKEQPVIQTFSTKQNPAFKAVPQKSPLVIEVKNQNGLFSLMKSESAAFAELRRNPDFEKLFSNISKFRDFVASHSGIDQLLKDKSIIISVNPTGKNQLTNLFLVQMNDQNESGSATDVVSRELGAGYTISRRNYDNAVIFGAKSLEMSFYFACASDIFMASEDFILIEEAIRHSNSQNLLGNKEFTEVYKTIEETAQANIFINHQTVHQLIAKLVTPEIRKNIGQLTSWSNWSELDFTVNANGFNFEGYSVTRDSSDNYLNIFRNQEAEKITIEKAIPANSTFFVALNLNNPGLFLDRYETHTKANGSFYPREMSLIEFQKKTKTDPVKLIKEAGGKQFAGVYTNINKSNPTQNRFFVCDLTDVTLAKERISKAVTEYSRTAKTDEGKLKTNFSIDSKNSVIIYQLPMGNMAESLFGRAFAGIQGEYLAFYEKHLIWGDNLSGMKNYLQDLASTKTLANDSVYKEYLKGKLANPNFYLYAKVPKFFRLKEYLLKPELSANLAASEEIVRKFSTFSWQFAVSDNMIKNQVNLKYDPNYKEEPQAVWQLKLDAPLVGKPKLVLNHKDLPNREVIVSDKQNNVYLINREGLVLWKINIPGDIVSEIHQIDLYRNNKFQYIFNTKTQLYVIDRMGNKVGKYPATLKSMASNGVSIAEYGQNKEYRFFVAGEDQKVYVFDRDGRLIPKWNFQGAESMVTKSVNHYDIEGKDYLVFTDKQNTYFLDRQGKSREIQGAPFERSNNELYFFQDGTPRLITTDPSGKIHIQDFNGQAEIKEVGKFGTGHRFAALDLTGDDSPEYLFAEGKKLTIIGNDGKKIAERSFPENITETPFICTSGTENRKIGIVTAGDNKIYLLDKNAAITKGFPLSGNSKFVLEKFNDSSSYFNLIVGSEDGTLVNYKIE